MYGHNNPFCYEDIVFSNNTSLLIELFWPNSMSAFNMRGYEWRVNEVGLESWHT